MTEMQPHPVLTGIHMLLTYQCTFECDHCFAWGSPWQTGTFTTDQIQAVLDQAAALGTVKEIYFEGGEPFLYYPTLVKAVQTAHRMGFSVGVVTNAYWALSDRDAREWLQPFVGKLSDLSVSSDLFHYDELMSAQARCAAAAARELGIPVGVICIASPESQHARPSLGMIPAETEGDGSAVMYRGRAIEKLAPQAVKHPWREFRRCPHEDLADPGRLHLDPLGYLQVCQGISIGNLFERPLSEIWAAYDPARHPVVAPLLEGGPALLAERYGTPPEHGVADACHLCDLTRRALRSRFPEILVPDQMYGVF